MKQPFVVAAAIAFWALKVQAQGVPVIDAANLAQAINQVLAWEQQYTQMLQQIQQLQFQSEQATKNLEAMTGTRSLGLISNTITQSVIDPNFRAQLTAAGNFTQANELGRSQIQNLTQATTARFGQIQNLMAAINTTRDPKSIAELNARILAEQAMIANEQKDAELLRQSLEQQIRAIEAARMQRSINASAQPVKVK
jgi:type IV secretion system protein VirB5